MKKLCIIGLNFSTLCNALKYINSNIEINIYEKKPNLSINIGDNYIYNLYNDNHKNYINLLKKFNISSTELELVFNDKIYNIINIVIEKSKLLPYDICISYTFINLCKNLLNQNDYDYLISVFGDNIIFVNINAYDFINIYKNDISRKLKYYYVSNDNINLLISKIYNLIKISLNITVNYNVLVENIEYKSNKFIINNELNFDYLITSISKKNLLEFKIWNIEQIKILNINRTIKLYNTKLFINKFFKINLDKVENTINISKLLLENLQIIFPQSVNKNKNVSIWNTYSKDKNINRIVMANKIKFLYNNKFFISGETYLKNSLFINYLIENIENTNFIKIKK